MIEDSVTLVTGGSKGIGEKIAKFFAPCGAKVAICGRNEEALKRVANEISEEGGICLPIAADVSDEKQVEAMVSKIEAELGPVDILINNAAELILSKITEMSLTDWERLMAINVRGVFLCCRAVLPSMMERKTGRIINIGSLAGRRGYPEQGAYCASKHALVGLTKVLAIETQPYGIRVNMVSPGGVMTELSASLRDSRGGVNESEWMTTEEVAEAVLYICNQDGAATTDELVLRRFASEPWR